MDHKVYALLLFAVYANMPLNCNTTVRTCEQSARVAFMALAASRSVRVGMPAHVTM
jgi:hypothetical protein